MPAVGMAAGLPTGSGTLRGAFMVRGAHSIALMFAVESSTAGMGLMSCSLRRVGGFQLLALIARRLTISAATSHDTVAPCFASVLRWIVGTSHLYFVLARLQVLRHSDFASHFRKIVERVADRYSDPGVNN